MGANDDRTRFEATSTAASGGGQSGPERSHTLLGEVGEHVRFDRFALLDAIGAGGMGELYAAYDPNLDRKIALKLVRPDRGSDIADSRLRREAQALARIAHPNVVSVFEVGFTEGRVFVAMEYVHGQDLGAWLESVHDLPEPQRVRELLSHFRDAAAGLAAVHRAGLAHRDFKPDNVLVGADGRVRLVDFGLARSTGVAVDEKLMVASNSSIRTTAVDEDDENERELPQPDAGVGILTNTGTMLGTPRYMAPEQWRALRGDSRSDQFSFCVALYHALHGCWPFEAESTMALGAAVLNDEPREPLRKPQVPASLRSALMRGLAREPADRAPDMGNLLTAIDKALEPTRRGHVAWLAAFAIGLPLALFSLLAPSGPSGEEGVDDDVARADREAAAEILRLHVATQITEFDGQGEFTKADEAFAAFVERPRHAHTRALARAWVDQAERMRVRGDPERQLAALGEALLASESESRAALLELARVQAGAHNYDLLGATLEVLGDEAADAELLSMRAQEAISRRDLSAALDTLARPEVAPMARQLGPLLRQLDQVSMSEGLGSAANSQRTSIIELTNIDVDSDGHDELLFLSGEGPALVLGSQPDLAGVQELELLFDDVAMKGLSPISVASGRPGAPSWVAARGGGHDVMFELAIEGGQVVAQPIFEFPGGRWTTGDLFTGPGWDGWEGFDTQLASRRIGGVHVRPGGAVELFTPQPSLATLDSFVESLAVMDFDGDGVDELVAGVDGWWAYDLRVLSPRSEPGSFELSARLKLGGHAGMISFPAPSGRGRWLAVSVPHTPPSPRVFPHQSPSGAPAGVYILAWGGPDQAIEIIDYVPLLDNSRPDAGDLDGDGRSELVVQLESALVVLRPGAELHDSMIWLSGLRHLAIVDLDHDGDDELIVSEVDSGRVMVLGAGERHLPPLERTTDRRLDPPSGLDPSLHDLWARAETLAVVGLFDQASMALTKLARLAGAGESTSALRRAADLLERGGARQRAADLYAQAGDPFSLERALTLYRAVHRFDAAADIAERRVTEPGLDDAQRDQRRAQASALRQRTGSRAELSFDLSEPLDAGWRVARPGLLRGEPSGLHVDAIGAPDSVLMRRALVWEGGRFELELELQLEHIEWGAVLVVELIPTDVSGATAGPPVGTWRVGAVGGGGHYVLERANHSTLEPDSVDESPRMRGAKPPKGQSHLVVRLDLTEGAPGGWVSVISSGQGRAPTSLAYQQPIPPGARRPGRYELRISSGTEPWARAAVRLLRLRLLGLRDDPNAPPATRREQVLRALVNADNHLALAQLDGASEGELDARDAAWLRALVLEQLGEWPQALPQVAAAMGRCDSPEALERFGYAMLLVPDRFGPALRERCPPKRFLVNIWRVAWTVLFHHPDIPDIHRTMTTQLSDLDLCQPADHEQAQACIDLLTARAWGWFMNNHAAAADSDLRRAIELVDTWVDNPTLTLDQQQRLSRVGALAHAHLAAVLVTRNRLEDAQIELATALSNDLAPEIIADVIVASESFEVLHAAPIWPRVVAAQAGREQ